jgi:hypothetical protein
MLIFLILAMFVGAPLISVVKIGEFLFDLFVSLLLLSGVVTVGRRRLLTAAVLAIVLLTLAIRWTRYFQVVPEIGVWYEVLSIASIGILTALVLMQVFRGGPITGYRIQGAVAAYLLLGLEWTNFYELVFRLWPDAFHFASFEQAAVRPTHSLAYFSFVTLTTLGYGDITPLHPMARSLAIGEALVGQLYPAILIGRLVSMEIAWRQPRK